MSFLVLEKVCKEFKSEAGIFNALTDVSFDLECGEFVVIIGPSGAGKTTLLNLLGGMDSPSRGNIVVDGVNISNFNKKELTNFRRNEVGFVFQFYNLIPDLTVEENVQVVSDISKNPLDIEEVLDAMGMLKYRYRFPKELSGGQQQRVAIARAIIKNPKILLCDELTGALDTKSSKSVLEFIEKINNLYKTTTVIITHNEKIAQMADRIIRIKDGKAQENKKNTSKKSASELEL